MNSPHKGQWRGALIFTLICVRINGWVNNCKAGDLRRNRAHYHVIVMRIQFSNPYGVCGYIMYNDSPDTRDGVRTWKKNPETLFRNSMKYLMIGVYMSRDILLRVFNKQWCFYKAHCSVITAIGVKWTPLWTPLEKHYIHDDVMKWQHFPPYWPFLRGIHRSLVDSPQKGQWRGALVFSLICPWTNGSASNRDAGDLRRHRAHYDVNVMIKSE